MVSRTRKFGSIKSELLRKSKEAMLAAVQIFNNPNMQFKSESFIVLAIIAWTYLLHAHYREKKIEYRYFEMNGKRKKFDTTKNNAHRYWELKKCLDCAQSPIDEVPTLNLKFLIGLRHEIEHRMTTRIDEFLNPCFQSCCLNYNTYLKKLFPNKDGIEKHLSFSLQFSSLSEEQVDKRLKYNDLPKNISSYIQDFEQDLSDDHFDDSRFSYRVFFIQKTANRRGQADRVIEFLPSNSDIAKGINKEHFVLKETEKKKYLPSYICREIQKSGFKNFKMHQHTQLWQKEDAKDPSKGFGAKVAKTWYWYHSWLIFVKTHCEKNRSKYT